QFEIVFSLPTAYDHRRDAVVQIEQGLTGTSNLNISDFGKAAPLVDGDRLDGRPSALAAFYDIAPEIRQVVSNVNAKIDPAYQKYESVLTKAEQTLSNFDKAVITGDAALAHARDI